MLKRLPIVIGLTIGSIVPMFVLPLAAYAVGGAISVLLMGIMYILVPGIAFGGYLTGSDSLSVWLLVQLIYVFLIVESVAYLLKIYKKK